MYESGEDVMVMNHKQLREEVVIPALELLAPIIPVTEAAVELLMMTAAHESVLGTYVQQIGGPAQGIYQMEPTTERDIMANYLKYRIDIWQKIDTDQSLITNLTYATQMARVHYFRDKEALPDIEDFEGLARYAKRIWNTKEGKAAEIDYLVAYNRLCISP